MPSPEAQALHDKIRQFRDAVLGSEHSPSIEEQRRTVADNPPAATRPEGVSIAEEYAGGCRAFWHDPTDAVADRVVLYLHGGGYVLGSPLTHERVVGHVAGATGCRLLNLDYRLAPEHPHPAAVEDASAAYRWLLNKGYAPEHIAISGESAGGGLALATLLSLSEQGLPQPAAAAPLSPWTDLEGTGESMTANADSDLFVGIDVVRRWAAAFLGDGNPRDPLAAPLYGDYSGLAPIYIQVGGDETLLDDSTRVAERARAAGVEVKLDVFPEMQHGFQMFVGNVPEATDAVRQVGDWLRVKLDLPQRDS